MKVIHCTNKKHVVKNRKTLGKSIEERPLLVEFHEDFCHFKIDTVNGKRDGSEMVLLMLTERKTRFEIIRSIDAEDANSVTYAIKQLISEYGSSFSHMFRSITVDNGSEFAHALLSETLAGRSEVYFIHPYTSCERVTNENHNRMIRHYIPKGMSIDQYDHMIAGSLKRSQIRGTGFHARS